MIFPNVRVGKQELSVFLFVTALILVVVASKFEPELSPSINLMQLLLVFVLYVSLNEINFELIPNYLNPKILFLLLAGFHLVSILLTQLDQLKPYLLWSKLGFGSMYLNSDLFIFGDLAHLTSWANCKIPIEIGSTLCDPFLRPSNQNPHVLSFFRFFDLSNLIAIGFIIICAFYFLVYSLFKSHKTFNFKLLILCLSPTIVLALERNNEVLTILLITYGLLFINQSKKQIYGSLFLVLAAIFKLWPIVIVGLSLCFKWKELSLGSKLVLSGGLFYWIVFLNNIFNMRNFTQNGSYFGGSFGFPLFFTDRASQVWMGLFLLFSFIFLAYLVKDKSQFKVAGSTEVATLTILFICYIFVWVSGISWAYRLLLLLPMLYFLENSQLSKEIIKRTTNLILVTLLTIQLSVTIFMTSILSVYFLAFIIVNSNSIKRDCLSIFNKYFV